MDVLTIAAFAAEQLIHETNTMYVKFVLTSFGPIVEVQADVRVPLELV